MPLTTKILSLAKLGEISVVNTYLVDDVVPPSLAGESEPVLKASRALLDQSVPLALVVLLAGLTVNLKKDKKKIY